MNRLIFSIILVVFLLPVGRWGGTGEVSAEEERFWSFRAPVRAEIPPIVRGDRVRTAIDRFVLARLEARGLTFQPDAGRRTLIRRLYLDLLGLPPEPSDVEAFLADEHPDAYDRLVERVLASPRYGERWGRHWLDVAGFAESSLFIGDRVRPDFWRYRDYVIRSLNADKPYDEFIVEQLAGDELFDWRGENGLTDGQIEKLVATGFLRCAPDATDNQGITQDEKIYAAQQSVVEVSMKALLGLTLNCVRCHSHKYDPIPHEDYYRLVAVFQPAFDPAKWLPGIYDPGSRGPLRAIPLTERQEREAFFRDGQDDKALSRELRQNLPGHFRDRYLRTHKEKLAADSSFDRLLELLFKSRSERSETEEGFVRETASRLGVTADVLRASYPEFERREQELQSQLAAIRKRTSKLPPLAWGVFDVSTHPSPTRLLLRGNYDTPGREVQPGFLSALSVGAGNFASSKTPPAGATTGRRLALAKRLVRSDQPLTARVLVNRIWQYHFGVGIVATPDDFGKRGARPTHPELLDWLAVELVESGWSIKQLHRRILLSTTYQQGAGAGRKQRALDPENQLLGWFPTRRLEAEAIRDSMLKVSGQLDERLYGPSVRTERLDDGSFSIDPKNEGRNRRTVYVSTRRTWTLTFLRAFDAPVMDTNCPKRSTSVVPQQSLAAMNSRFALECAGRFADRVLAGAGETFAERLGSAYELTYGRPPVPEEVELCRHAVSPRLGEGAATDASDDVAKAWRTICQALLSSNEFVHLD